MTVKRHPLFFMPTCSNPFVSSRSPKTVTGRIYPNGRCGWSPTRESHEPLVKSSDLSFSPDVDQEFDIKFARLHGVDALRSAKEKAGTLGLANVTNSHSPSKKRAPRGLKGLTSHGKRLLQNAAEYLEWRFGRRHISFVTLTLPGITAEENAAITANWSDITRTFNQSIGRKLNASGLPNWILGCYEIQPLREQKSGIPVLHYHFICVGRGPKNVWAITPQAFRRAWRSAVISRVPSVANYDFSASEKVVRVRKSVAGYLSKYLSKGESVVRDVATPEAARTIPAWYTCSSLLRRIVHRSVRSGRHVGELLSTLDERFFLFRKPIECVDSSGHRFTVGWYGILKRGWSQLIDVPVLIPIEESDAKVSQFRFPKQYHDGYSSIALNV